MFSVTRYIFDFLCPVVVPYISDGPNPIIQQDNARPHFARRVLTFLDTQGVVLLFCPAWSCVAEGLARNLTPANIVDEVWRRLEAVWNELLVSVVRIQFDSMPIRVRAIFTTRSGRCFY